MNRKLFHTILDELAECWYIDTTKIIYDEPQRAGKSRALRLNDLTTKEMLKGIEANDPNPTGFPIVERWRHKYKPEIIRVKQRTLNIM